MKQFRFIFFMVCHLFLATQAHAIWQSKTSGVTQNLNSVYFVDSSTGWAVGASGTIIKTKDGGESWLTQNSGVTTNIQGTEFVGTSTGIAVGSSGLILRTTDAIVWRSVTSGTGNGLFDVAWSVSTGVVWAVGSAGTILKSVDSGETWTDGDPDDDAPSRTLRSIFFMSSTIGWAVGDSQTLIKTVDGGLSWTDLSLEVPNQNLRDVFFTDVSTGYIVGDNGVVSKSTDGGTGWASRFTATTNFNTVHFVSTDTGWVAGNAGEVIISTAKGFSFLSDPSNTSANLNDLYFVTPTLGFAVGDAGSIIKSIPITSLVDSNISTDTVRQQGSLTPLNNLFDPSKGQSTTIRYFFKKVGQVHIRIFSLQGRLIRTLLNEQRVNGVYEDVFWDGRNDNGEMVASGIYLVHIDAPSFKDIKKIAVIR